MGERAQRLLLLVLFSATVACKADTPPLTGENDAIGVECTPYADELVAYTPAEGGNPDDGNLALGAPDEQAVNLAVDDVLTIGFIGLGGVTEMEEDGADIRLHAIAVDGTEVNAYLSLDGEAWENAGSVGNFDLEADLDLDIADTASLSLVVYLQLVGVTGQLAVDAVQSLQTVCSTSVR